MAKDGALTEPKIKALIKAGKPVAGVSDGNGLTFRISDKGLANWVLRYRFGGRQKTLYLGQYPEISLKEARGRALIHRAEVFDGVDVAREKQLEQHRAKTALSMAQLFDEYAKRVLAVKYRKPEPWIRLIDRHLRPELGVLLAKDVVDADVIRAIDKMRERGIRAEANHALRVMKRVFRYARSRRYIERSPVAEIGTDAAGGPEKPRARALSRDELSAFLKSMTDADIHQADRLALRILIATLCRIGELVKARWENVDLEDGVWTIPDEDAKVRAIDVPLAPAVAGWFKELKVLAGGSEYVFPARRRRHLPHINQQTIGRAQRAAMPAGMEHFTLHDLRRTGRTILPSLGVSGDVAERCLNHALEGVRRVYDQHDYFEERRHAMELYAALVLALEKGDPKVLGHGRRSRSRTPE